MANTFRNEKTSNRKNNFFVPKTQLCVCAECGRLVESDIFDANDGVCDKCL